MVMTSPQLYRTASASELLKLRHHPLRPGRGTVKPLPVGGTRHDSRIVELVQNQVFGRGTIASAIDFPRLKAINSNTFKYVLTREPVQIVGFELRSHGAPDGEQAIAFCHTAFSI
jgi:hypothetical protein